MTTEWTVYVASYKRAGLINTDRIINNCRVVVPKGQMAEYEKFELYNGAELLPLPDKADGNLCRKRNWILDHAQKEGQDNVLIVDDDYNYVGYVEEGNARRCTLDQVDGLIGDGFQLAADLGVVMWGINLQIDPRFYREYAPLSMLSPILGPWQAFVATPLRYDEDLWLKEDYDLWLRTVHRYRKTLRINKYHYQVDQLGREGGQQSKRTLAEEERQLRRLREKFGGNVVTWDLDRSINPRVRVPIKGI